MNDIEIVSRYMYSTLSEELEIPVYNGLTIKKPKDTTFCKFYVLDGSPRKYVSNQVAFTEFTVRVNIWSNEFKYILLGDLIDFYDGKQGVVVSGEGTDTGYIQSVIYTGQYTMQDDIDKDYIGIGFELKVRTKNKTN